MWAAVWSDDRGRDWNDGWVTVWTPVAHARERGANCMFRRGSAVVVALVMLTSDSRIYVMGPTGPTCVVTLHLRPNQTPKSADFPRFGREPSPLGPDAARVCLTHSRLSPNFPSFTRGFAKFEEVCPIWG